MKDDIILMSLGRADLEGIIRNVLQEELAKMKEKDLMSFHQTTEFLGISTSTLNVWKSKTMITYKRLGKRIFFSRKEVLDSLKDSNYTKLKNLQ